MTTYLGKSCSFGLPRVPFVNCRQFMYLVIIPFGFEGRMWDLIVSVPDHCLSFYFVTVIREITQNPVFQFYESILSEKTDCLWTESGQNIERFIILI